MSRWNAAGTTTARESEARRSAVGHRGPTADRYAGAIEQYVGAVLADEPAPEVPGLPALGFPPASVADAMVRNPVSVGGQASFNQVVAALDHAGSYAVPVVDDEDRVIGIITVSDLLARMTGRPSAPRLPHRVPHADTHRKRHARTALELMTAPALTTPPTATIAQAAVRLARRRIRSMPVVDHETRLIGMVGREQLVKQFLRDDEDIRVDVPDHILPSALY